MLKTRYAGGTAGIEVLARNSINPKQSLCLVKLGSRLVLLGVSPQQVSALETISEPEEIALVMGQLERHKPYSISNSFGKLLRRETKNYAGGKGAEENAEPLTGPGHPAWDQAKGELSTLLNKVKGLGRMKFH